MTSCLEGAGQEASGTTGSGVFWSSRCSLCFAALGSSSSISSFSPGSNSLFFSGSADRAYVALGLSYTAQIWVYRVLVWLAPPVVFLLVRRVCRELVSAERIERERELAEEEARGYASPGRVRASAERR